jgi:HEAT repeat protein
VRPKTVVATLVLCWMVVATAAFGAPPRTVNAKIVARAPSPDLAGAITAIVGQQVEPAWIGYSVPVFNRGDAGRQDGWSERCRLEQTQSDSPTAPLVAGPIKLEPSPTISVLLRIQNREIQRIRTLSTDCAIDAGGLTFYWLDPVAAAQSVAFLKSFVAAADPRRLHESALNAISLHEDRSASTVLLDLVKNGAESRIRQRALVSIARRAESQSAAVITDAIERDPDVEVKKQAVFALSQLPKDEGIPLLIRIARTSTHPVVRKQAIYWLGQSRDPRAVAYFEEILGNK